MADLIFVCENGGLGFGNYTLEEKAKLSDYPHLGDLYKIKTFKEITKLEKNFNYRMFMKRLSDSLELGFYIEAITLEYAIMEDRLKSILKHSNRFSGNRHNSLNNKIIGVKEGLRPEDMCFVMETDLGKQFTAKPACDAQTRIYYLNNPELYIGKYGTCKFFYYSEDKIPLQPVFKNIREEDE